VTRARHNGQTSDPDDRRPIATLASLRFPSVLVLSFFCPQFRELVGEIVDKLYEYPGLVGETPADFVDMGKLLQRGAFTWALLGGLEKKAKPKSFYIKRSKKHHPGVTSAIEVRPTCFCNDDPQTRSHLRVS
jgi:hypothetical protein